MTNRPKAIGTATETAVVRYLTGHGFPSAERSPLHGAVDEGDITGTPGVAWEVKGGHAAENASDGQVEAWLAETEIERKHRSADVAVLVLKRKGKGASNAGLWWAVMPGWVYLWLTPTHVPGLDTPSGYRAMRLPPVRMTLAHAVNLLRYGGYGDPL